MGSGRFLDDIDAVQLSPQGRAYIAKFSHPLIRETVRDHLVNRRFRSDIFVKGPRKLSTLEQRQAWRSQGFLLSVPAHVIPKTIVSGCGEVELPAELYDPVIEVLAEDLMKIKRVGDLAQHPKLRGFEFHQLLESLIVLTGAGFLQPAEEPTDKALSQCRALNRYITQRARVSMDLCHLASPVTGCAIGVPHISQLFIHALYKGREDADGLANDVWEFLQQAGERLVKEGKRNDSKSGNIDELRRLAVRFLKIELPTLKSLRIVDVPSSTIGDSDTSTCVNG